MVTLVVDVGTTDHKIRQLHRCVVREVSDCTEIGDSPASLSSVLVLVTREIAKYWMNALVNNL